VARPVRVHVIEPEELSLESLRGVIGESVRRAHPRGTLEEAPPTSCCRGCTSYLDRRPLPCQSPIEAVVEEQRKREVFLQLDAQLPG